MTYSVLCMQTKRYKIISHAFSYDFRSFDFHEVKQKRIVGMVLKNLFLRIYVYYHVLNEHIHVPVPSWKFKKKLMKIHKMIRSLRSTST